MTQPSPELLEAMRRYEAAMHGMQSGVQIVMDRDPTELSTTPKHLRVGVNSAMIESSTIVKILIDKGLLTDLEWATSLAEMAEAERDSYQAQVNKLFGSDDRIVLE